jgi:hypothetical protein
VARLTDLPEWDRRRHLDRIRALPEFGPSPFVPGPPVRKRRIALVGTSGLHERGDRPFEVGSADYRVIRGDTAPGDLVMGAALRREIAQLAPWYERARTRRGRTTVGVSGLGIEDAAIHAVSHVGASPRPPYADGISAGTALKRACDDLKAYYYEAAAGRPENLTATAIDAWFWHDTAAAKVFLALQQVCLKSADSSLRPLGEIALVPRAIFHTLVEPHHVVRSG